MYILKWKIHTHIHRKSFSSEVIINVQKEANFIILFIHTDPLT